jgi:hypothetical protein
MSLASKIFAECDLSEMFGIEIAPAKVSDTPATVLCGKCKGKGKFISYSGRVVGPCFTCNGSGLSHMACLTAKEGDCDKCGGSGEWRPGRPCFACNGKGKPKIAAEINVTAIATAFEAANSNGIKRPKLRLDTFTFSRAPDAGKNAGSIYVKEGAKYIGKVSAGKFHPTMACDDPTEARVIAAASDPHQSAKAYGMKTGSCSCCGRELTNGISIELGIGPICRSRFGW